MTSRPPVRVGAQGFEGSPLDRSVLASDGAVPGDVATHPASRFLAVAHNKPMMQRTEGGLAPLWLSREQLQHVLRSAAGQAGGPAGPTAAGAEPDSEADGLQETYLLGRHPDGHFCFAASLPADSPNAAEAAVQAHAPAAQAMEARALMSMSTTGGLAMIGHAIALVTWHNVRPCPPARRLLRAALRALGASPTCTVPAPRFLVWSEAQVSAAQIQRIHVLSAHELSITSCWVRVERAGCAGGARVRWVKVCVQQPARPLCRRRS